MGIYFLIQIKSLMDNKLADERKVAVAHMDRHDWNFVSIWKTENSERPGEESYGFNFDLQPVGTVFKEQGAITRTLMEVVFNHKKYPNPSLFKHLGMECQAAKSKLDALIRLNERNPENKKLLEELKALQSTLNQIINNSKIFNT